MEGLPGSAPLLSLTKGLAPESGDRLSTLVRGRPVAVMSGPNMAEELAAGLPGFAAGSICAEALRLAAETHSTPNVYATSRVGTLKYGAGVSADQAITLSAAP